MQQSTMTQVLHLCREEGVGNVVNVHIIYGRAPWLNKNRISASLAKLAYCGDLHRGEMIKGIRQYKVLPEAMQDRSERGVQEGYHHAHERAAAEPVLDHPVRSQALDLLIDAGVLLEGDRVDAALEMIRKAYYLVRDNKRR